MNEAYQNLLTRRSCRAYTEEQVKPEDLDAILEAGMYAPTAMGRQSPLMVAVQDADLMRKIERLNAAAVGNPEARTFYGAPMVIIVFGTDTLIGTADANLVIGNLLNAAHAVGVDSCYIWRAREVFDSEEGKALKETWGIPENYVGVGNVILGYGKHEGKREPAPRKADYVRRV